MRDDQARLKEGRVAKGLRRDSRPVLQSKQKAGEKEDWLTGRLLADLGRIGKFCRDEDGTPFFLRHSDRRLYEVSARPESAFAKLVTWLADLSATTPVMKRSVERLHAKVGEEAETAQIHALAYNSADAEVIAINDFGGGMWYRRRGGAWEWKPNGSEGILFWTPPEFVEPWVPEFSTDAAIQDEDHLQWFLEQLHFGDDVLTVGDQRMLLRTSILSLFFPSRNRTRPVPANLPPSQSDHRQHDTGKTTGGKLIGHLLVGSKFEPTPIDGSEKGQEGLHLALMNQPLVLLDNVDTDIRWLNDFLCTYATGGRLPRRKLYKDTTLVYYDPRGRLWITSRKVRFNRPDTASRVIPFRFKPISEAERRTEPELLDPVDARRGRIWAGLLSTVARVQDALLGLSPPSPSLRLADFEAFGWCVAAVNGQEDEWGSAMVRLRAAQAGFALEGEALLPILRELLKAGDVPEQPTSEFYKPLSKTAERIGLGPEGPLSAAACTARINELRELLESVLDVRIVTRTLHGQTLIRITRGPSWDASGVTGVTGSPLLLEQSKGGKYEE